MPLLTTHRLVGSFIAVSGFLVAQQASALPWNLQVRHTSVPNSCDFAVFEPELKLINTGTSTPFLSEVFAEFSFNAGADEIQAVHPDGTYAAIFDANGAFVSWDGAHVVGPFPQTPATFAPDRKANQTWRVTFDPPDPRAQSILVPPGGFATIIVTLQRKGGLSPFDVDCDDFTKVERNSPGTFVDNKFFRLIFTSTQQLICERLPGGAIDPNTGIFSFPGFNNGCPAQ